MIDVFSYMKKKVRIISKTHKTYMGKVFSVGTEYDTDIDFIRVINKNDGIAYELSIDEIESIEVIED